MGERVRGCKDLPKGAVVIAEAADYHSTGMSCFSMSMVPGCQWIFVRQTSIDVMYGIRGRLDARDARVTMAVSGIPNAAGINVNVMSTAMVMHSLLARYLRIHHNESNKR
jgi:hypothetical protein